MTVHPVTRNPAYQSYQRDITRTLRAIREASEGPPEAPALTPASREDRTGNEMRPHSFHDVVGQAGAKKLLVAAVRSAQRTGRLDHMLLTGPAGTGKSTLAHVTGEELGVDVFQVSAPISYDTLLELRVQMKDGDILYVDEIHLQAIAERRGKESITQPEVLYSILEDRVIVTPRGTLPYPAITMIGATTDPGRLPQSFLDRFPLRPRLVEYTDDDLAVIAKRNAAAIGMTCSERGARAIALAAAGTPRIVNNLVKNARLFGRHMDERAVREVREATGISEDGLSADQQAMLSFLLNLCATTTRNGTVYQGSLGSIATTLGLSRDVKAVQLYVEPLLIRRGYIQTTSQGRRLTDLGIVRATRIGRKP